MNVLQDVVAGLGSGCGYALMALGLVFVFKSSGVLNFAHGSIATLSIYCAWALSPGRALLPLALCFGALFSTGLYLGLVRPQIERARSEADESKVILTTLAAFIVIEGGVAWVWGSRTRPLRLDDGSAIDLPFGAVLSTFDLRVMLAAVLATFGAHLLFRRTRFGRVLRASRASPRALELVGIDPRTHVAAAWAIGGALAALAGVAFMPRVMLEPSSMFSPLIKAFAVAVLGGLDSIPGVLVAGCLLGVLEVLIGAHISLELQSALSFLVIMGVLLVRAQGLFGRAPTTRA